MVNFLMIHNSLDRWPFPEATGRVEWTEIRKADAIELRDCVPPLTLGVGYFFVGEPVRHLNSGEPVHDLVILSGNRAFLKEIPVGRLRQELREFSRILQLSDAGIEAAEAQAPGD